MKDTNSIIREFLVLAKAGGLSIREVLLPPARRELDVLFDDGRCVSIPVIDLILNRDDAPETLLTLLQRKMESEPA